MKSVIKCKTAIEMWNDFILAHEGPSDTRDTKIAALRLKFNAFKSLEGKKDYKGKYKGLKAEMDVLTKRIDDMTKGKSKNGKKNKEKSERGLLAESVDWDDEPISSDDEVSTKIRALWQL
nr:hypothetical protein [Tanacetum cinerariifolium]